MIPPIGDRKGLRNYRYLARRLLNPKGARSNLHALKDVT